MSPREWAIAIVAGFVGGFASRAFDDLRRWLRGRRDARGDGGAGVG